MNNIRPFKLNWNWNMIQNWPHPCRISGRFSFVTAYLHGSALLMIVNHTFPCLFAWLPQKITPKILQKTWKSIFQLAGRNIQQTVRTWTWLHVYNIFGYNKNMIFVALSLHLKVNHFWRKSKILSIPRNLFPQKWKNETSSTSIKSDKTTRKWNLTSNDIIAGNGRILSVHEYCVVIFV